MRIAQRFSVGFGARRVLVPKGRLNRALAVWFSRPFGTHLPPAPYPRLKPWAILSCPCRNIQNAGSQNGTMNDLVPPGQSSSACVPGSACRTATNSAGLHSRSPLSALSAIGPPDHSAYNAIVIARPRFFSASRRTTRAQLPRSRLLDP